MNQPIAVPQLTLSFEGSQIMLRAAERHATAIGVPMCIAIVDVGGHLIAFSRMEGARTGNIRLAQTKAVSAAMRRRATADELNMSPNEPTHAIRLTLAAGTDLMTSSSGGLPIVIDGVVAGGIGVSNGRADDDIAVARAGIDALGLDETGCRA